MLEKVKERMSIETESVVYACNATFWAIVKKQHKKQYNESICCMKGGKSMTYLKNLLICFFMHYGKKGANRPSFHGFYELELPESLKHH